MSLQIYDILKPLPLFQGLGSSEIQDIVAHIRFGFSQFKKGQPIIRREENCRGLVYLINGEMDIMTCGENDSFRLYEHVSAPYLIEPERVFGLRLYPFSHIVHRLFVAPNLKSLVSLI